MVHRARMELLELMAILVSTEHPAKTGLTVQMDSKVRLEQQAAQEHQDRREIRDILEQLVRRDRAEDLDLPVSTGLLGHQDSPVQLDLLGLKENLDKLLTIKWLDQLVRPESMVKMVETELRDLLVLRVKLELLVLLAILDTQAKLVAKESLVVVGRLDLLDLLDLRELRELVVRQVDLEHPESLVILVQQEKMVSTELLERQERTVREELLVRADLQAM